MSSRSRPPRAQQPSPSAATTPPAASRSVLGLVRRLLREPLVHFLLAGALVFAVYELLNPAVGRIDANQIVLTKDDVRQLAIAWLAQGRAPPTPAQMSALIEQKVSEEILWREAVALGLDRDDEIIKRRLAQKMDFLTVDIAALQDPGNAELRQWFAQHADRFAFAPRISFRHLYFTLDRGPGARDAAMVAQAGIADESVDAPELATVGDPFMFQDYYADRAPDQVTREFGPEFAKSLFALDPGAWRGPIQSGYGWHLVFVTGKEPGRTPAFEEVEPNVKSAWLDEKQQEIKRFAYEAMRSRYTVVVPPIDAAALAHLNLPQSVVPAADVVPQ